MTAGLLDELISNSFKAGATVMESRIEDQGERVIVYVKNNGHGMCKETLERGKKTPFLPAQA